MRLSISKGNQGFKEITVNHLSDLSKYILEYNYAPATFEKGDRKNAKFIAADLVALDIDEGLTLSAARKRLEGYDHIIAPTRNHMKEKNGKVESRFRILMPLERTVTDAKEYRATILELMNMFPEADKACKDAARMYYPSVKFEKSKTTGKAWPVSSPQVKPEPIQNTTPEIKGKLRNETLHLLLFGAQPGTANTTLYKAAKDCQRSGYSIEDVSDMVQTMIDSGGTWDGDHVNDLDVATIERAFSTDPNTDEYAQESHFDFLGIGSLMKKKLKFDWVVDGLLQAKGLSIIAGRPKSGKSTLTRQLAKAIVRGEDFLGRSVKKGKVLYCALEESDVLLQQQFRRLGMNESDDESMKIHIGNMDLERSKEPLIEYIKQFGATLIVIDTLSLFAKFVDSNNYDEVDRKMTIIRDIARGTGCHVVLIHHTNKAEGIMGSQGLLGAVDAAVYFVDRGSERYIKTIGRGLRGFNYAKLSYNPENETYTFDKEEVDEF